MEAPLHKIEVNINDIKNAVQEIENLLFKVKNYVNISEQIYYNILVSFSEAVNNALIHGNKLDKSKNVNVKLQIDENELFCVIQDEGEGFIPDNVLDPRMPENLLKDNGRGVFLIKELSNESEYINTGKGMMLKMKFLLKGI